MNLLNNKLLSNSVRNNNKNIQIYNINKNATSKSKENINNFFITKLENFKKPHIIKNSKSTNILKVRNKLFEKYKIKEKEDELLKDNFIDFATNYKDYINVDKIISYYRSLGEKNKKKFDENSKIIEEKRKYLDELDLQLNAVIIENIKIDKEEIEKLYEKKN